MSAFSDLLAKAQQLEFELGKEGTVLVGEAKTILEELMQNLKHEVDKEVGAPTPPAAPTAPDVQRSTDI